MSESASSGCVCLAGENALTNPGWSLAEVLLPKARETKRLESPTQLGSEKRSDATLSKSLDKRVSQ